LATQRNLWFQRLFSAFSNWNSSFCSNNLRLLSMSTSLWSCFFFLKVQS
jgi:hypothetical protein